MSSTNFTFDDVVLAVREQLNDNASRRITDTDILLYHLPGVYQQLRNDRPDLFIGLFTATINFKPSASDPLPFGDEGYYALVQALLADVQERAAETASGAAGAADARSERARK